jgi:hypothetical protein
MFRETTNSQARGGLWLLTITASLTIAATIAAEDRSIDGSGNNLVQPDFGRAGSRLLRVSPSAYADGLSAPAGATRPGPRVISNTVNEQEGSIPNARGLSDWIWQWGQFMDHDLDLVPPASPQEPLPIPVPPDDPVFDFPTIPFNRSTFDPATGIENPREQTNAVTAWIDGSTVYGSDPATAASLREFSGGRLLVSAHPSGDLLPVDAAGFFRAGDPRVNEQVGLTAIHTLFVREHNRLAAAIADEHPEWTDEQIYQRARKIVGAEIQSITLNEWLPALLGEGAIPRYRGYNPKVEPTVANEFAGALFRVGHTMLSPVLARIDDSGEVIAEGNLALQDAFFSPGRVRDEGGISPLLKGLASQPMQEVDILVVDAVRNFLFIIPTGGLDLPSLNIQRGRDHGLSDFNSVRVAYGLPAVSSFDGITSDPALAQALEALYGDVNNIDLWVGGLSEDRLPDSSLGDLLFTAIREQFLRLRDGDRFWFENDRDLRSLRNTLRRTRLSDVIARNTGLKSLQGNVFFVPEACEVDWNGDGRLDGQDLVAFLRDLFAGNPRADFNGDGSINFADFFAFLRAWREGCDDAGVRRGGPPPGRGPEDHPKH